jgi:hypothetical protein
MPGLLERRLAEQLNDSRCRVLTGGTRTSEQTWSKHDRGRSLSVGVQVEIVL